MDNSDNELTALFAADRDAYVSESFVVRTREILLRRRRRARLLQLLVRILAFSVVGLASPWLINGSRAVSDVLGTAFESVRQLVSSPIASAVVLVLVPLLYLFRYRWR